MALQARELHDLAKRGAALRLTELQEETRTVEGILRDIARLQAAKKPRAPQPIIGGKREHTDPAPAVQAAADVAPPPPQKRRTMSKKARKAISVAQKRRWAAINNTK